MECILPTEETLHSLKHSKLADPVLLFASHMFHWRRPKGCLDEACASLTVSFTVLSFLSGQTTAGASVGEYLINEALPVAIAMVRDDGGHSPLEAAEVLVSCISCFLSPQHLQLSSCFPCELVVTNPVQQTPPPPPLPSPRSIICSIPVKTQTSCGQQTLYLNRNEQARLTSPTLRMSSAATSIHRADAVTQVDVLKHTDSRGSFYDDSTMLAAALEALGHLRLQDSTAVKPVVRQLTRFLAREKVLPSYHAVVAQAGLRAFVELALSTRPSTGLISK